MNALLKPAFWIAALPLFGVCAFWFYELPRRKAEALLYLGAYYVAGTILSVFLAFVLSGLKDWRASEHYGVLIVSGALFVLGAVMRWLTLRR